MSNRSRKKTLLASAVVATAIAALPGEVTGGHRATPFDVAATIAKCGGQSLTIATEIEPATARAARRVRGATLRVRFEAAPLFGRSRRSREFELGRTARARRFHRFSGLRAQSYSGIVRYRWVRGKRTVMSGFERTRSVRAAGRRGKAFCSLRVGRRPVDTQPPSITPIPGDGTRQSGPIDVRFFVFDNLSGVKLVVSRVDGGPFVRGRAARIEGVGSHRLEYVARDAAGNQTPVFAATYIVD
jgi:hypothetical protein